MGWQHGNEIQAEATLQIHPWGCLGSEASRGAEWAAGAQAEGKEQQSSSTSVQRGAGNSPVTPRGLIHEQSPSCWAGRV